MNKGTSDAPDATRLPPVPFPVWSPLTTIYHPGIRKTDHVYFNSFFPLIILGLEAMTELMTECEAEP